MVSNVIIRKSIPKDIEALKGSLRDIDDRECRAFGYRASEALRVGFEQSEICLTAHFNNAPVMMFGVRRNSLMFNDGIPWLLGTDAVIQIGRQIIRQSKGFIRLFLWKFEYLENYVHAENVVSINWLKWMGFTIEPPEPCGIHKELFHRFWMRRK